MNYTRLILVLLGLLVGCCASRARGAELILHQGGRVWGEIKNPHPGVPSYSVITPFGGEVSVGQSLVNRVEGHLPYEAEYEQKVAELSDTVPAHWELSVWCRQQGLQSHRDAHLRRILQLDPEHADARRLLGYAFVHGQWLSQDEHMRRRGYERYNGRWRIAQEIQLIQEREETEKLHTTWLRTIHRWREHADRCTYAQARHELLQVRDPAAVPALTQFLYKEQLRPFKLLLIEALAEIGGDDALRALVIVSLSDADEEIFHACLDHVVEQSPPFAVKLYIEALGQDVPESIRRAAQALARLDDDTAIRPLIDVLVTVHALSQSAPAVTTTFARSSDLYGTTGPLDGQVLQTGADKTLYRVARNQAALDALVQLSRGTSFGFNQQSWINWHALHKQRSEGRIDPRRDQ